jgi:hypothetical protein
MCFQITLQFICALFNGGEIFYGGGGLSYVDGGYFFDEGVNLFT